MAWIYSTGAINLLSGGWPTRKLFNDFVLDLYSGAAPATADAAATGTKLLRVTVGSGAILSTTRSAAQIYTLAPANRTNANTIKVNVTVDGVGPTTYTYTIATAGADSSDLLLAVNLARWLEDNVPQIQAIGYGALTLCAKCKIDGLALTLADGTGTTAITVTSVQANSRATIYTLQFGAPAAGVISKTSDVWSGVGLVSAVAGYGRLVLPTDSGGLSTSEPRAQGNVATSGAEITMSNTSITAGATSTVDAASITKPTGA